MRDARQASRPARRLALLLLAACALVASPAHGAGVKVRIISYVSKEDDAIGVIVRAIAGQGKPCYGDVRRGSQKVHLDQTATNDNGAVQWSWDVAAGVRGAYWRASVTCKINGRDRTRTAKRFFVDPVPGKRVGKRLTIPGSLRIERSSNITKPVKGQLDPYLTPPGSSVRLARLRRTDLPDLGDANGWVARARSKGFPTGSRPLPGAIAVFPPNRGGVGPYGHVAYVTAVTGASITVEDFDGDRPVVRRNTIPWAGLQFIYRKGQSEPPPPPPPPPPTNLLESRKVVDAPGTNPTSVTWDGASLWVGDVDGTVFKLDAAGGVADSLKAPPGEFSFGQGGLVSTGSGFVVFDRSGGTGTIYDFVVTGTGASQRGSFAAPPTASQYGTFMSWDGSALWFANGYTVRRLSAAGAELGRFTVGTPIEGLSAHRGDLWITRAGNLTTTILDKVSATGATLATYTTRIALMGAMTWIGDSLFALGGGFTNYDLFRVDAPAAGF